MGPPLVRIGRRVFYRADAFREWMIARERGPVVSRRGGPMNAPLLIAERREARLLAKRAVGLFVGAELCFMSDLRKLRDCRQPRGKAKKKPLSN